MRAWGLAALLLVGGIASSGCGDDDDVADGGLSEGGTLDASGASGAASAGRSGSGGSGGASADAGPGDGGITDAGGDAGLIDPLACENSLDCADQTEDRSVCHPLLRRCVQCTRSEDCDEHNDCVDHECRPYTTCQNSLDCELGNVCDSARERCVACVMDADCGEEEVCANDVCERACDSDNDCTPLAKLCDLTAGHCAECVLASDCPDERYCTLGRCAVDECSTELTRCTEQGGSVLTCAEDGSGPLPPVACDPQQGCAERSGAASCQDWACTPDAIECVEDELVTCSHDGLEVEDSEDCDADDKVCAQQACRTLACMPSSQSCDGNVLRLCASDGLTSQSLGSCPEGQYCDPDAAACVAGVCAPSEPACSGSVATTCNAGGSGYEAGGDDCTGDGDACVDGACEPVICTPDVLGCNDDGDVERCNATGTGLFTEQVCTAGQYCANGACMTQLCMPDQVYCSDLELRRCNALGSAYEVEDTCDASQRCDAEEEACVDIPDGGTGSSCSGTTGCPTCAFGNCCLDGMCGCLAFFVPGTCTKSAPETACSCN